ncbi:MAG: replication-relaxation family protein [Dehalococcoidia bacterium]|nr:replication-relaxation family protein [Dehalococcoidia bacterium]
MALLLGDPEPDVASVLHHLDGRGWVDWIDSPSPNVEPGRLYILSEPVRKWIGETLEDRSSPGQLALPLARNEILHRLGNIEASIQLNCFAAALVVSSRLEPQATGVDFQALPVRRRDSWWPAGVHGFAMVRCRDRYATPFVAVDAAGAPTIHRKATVAGWYAHRDRQDASAQILVLTADVERSDEWTLAVRQAAERRGVAPLDVLSTRREASSLSILRAPTWQSSVHRGVLSLQSGLAWRQGEVASSCLSTALEAIPGELPRTLRLHEWARRTVDEPPTRARRGTVERVAALSLSTTPEQTSLLECVGRLPLLTESDLSLVLATPQHLLRRQLDRSMRQGLVEVMPPATEPSRFVLAELGLRLLAGRAGVPFRRFAEHTSLVAALPGAGRGRLDTLLRQFEHTVGANSFFVACLAASKPDGPRLVAWRSAIETVVRFESGGVRRSLRPDGAGDVTHEGLLYGFFLEWDRGTERIAVLFEKLDRYEAYYRALSTVPASAPALLIVTPSPHRENVIWQAVDTVMATGSGRERVRTTVASLIAQRGAYAPIWRSGMSSPRRSWPE